jgi:hypothetical protein
MTILAIDPGPVQSGVCELINGKPFGPRKVDNDLFLEHLRDRYKHYPHETTLVIEMIASYGMPVGREVFETCVWIGKFIEAWRGESQLIYRKTVKLHLCGQARAKDANIRQAIIDRFGGKALAMGTRQAPGPLREVKADAWSALALAITYSDTRKQAA